jgi:hypothetical protein
VQVLEEKWPAADPPPLLFHEMVPCGQDLLPESVSVTVAVHEVLVPASRLDGVQLTNADIARAVTVNWKK